MEHDTAHEIAEAWIHALGETFGHQRDFIVTLLKQVVPEPEAYAVHPADRERASVLTAHENRVCIVDLNTAEGDAMSPDGWTAEVESYPLDERASIRLRVSGIGGRARTWTLRLPGSGDIEINSSARTASVKGEAEHFARTVASRLGFESLDTDPLGSVG